jgi:hypothetical protein
MNSIKSQKGLALSRGVVMGVDGTFNTYIAGST